MGKSKKRQNYPNKQKDNYYSMFDEVVDQLDANLDDYDSYGETLEFLKQGKTLGGRRFK